MTTSRFAQSFRAIALTTLSLTTVSLATVSLATVSVATLVLADTAQAQTAPPTPAAGGDQAGTFATGDIIVTARRKQERLQDVPIAVSAFGKDKLASLDIVDQTRLSDFTPGLQFTDFGQGRTTRGAYRSLIFRGLDLSNNTSVTAAGLVFVDGAPVVSGDFLITDAIERVEVLKGPQNVYFGRSTFSGAVNYVTRNPGNDFAGSVAAEVGNYDSYKITAHAEGPIVRDVLTMALDAQFDTSAGQYQNAAQPDSQFGGRKTRSIAATIYATPAPGLTIKAYLNYFTYNDGHGSVGFLPSSLANCNPGGQTGGAFYQCGRIGQLDGRYIAETLDYTPIEREALEAPPGYRTLLGPDDCGHFGSCVQTLAGHVIINYKTPGGVVFSEITAYHHRDAMDIANLVEVDATDQPNPLYGNPAYPTAPPYNTFDYSIANRTKDLSTELRVSSPNQGVLRWTAGGNYVDTTELQQILFYTGAGIAPPPANGQTYFGSVGAKTVGLFGGLYLVPVDSLTISAEGRWQADDRQDISSTDGSSFQKTFRSFSPRVSVDYKIDRDLNLYASYARGVRPGGFNAVLSGLPPALLAQITAQTGVASIAYKEETLETTEVGFKGALFDEHLRTNVSAYIGKLSNQQTSTVAFTSDVSGGGSGGQYTIISNQGAVDIKGVEGDLDWRASRMLDLSATFAYNGTKITASNCATCAAITGSPNIDGKRLTGAPAVSFSLAGDLTDHLSARYDWFAHADLVYRGNIWIDQVNLLGTGDSTRIGMEAGVRTPDRRLSLSAFVNNLTDNRTVTGGVVGLDFTTFSNYGVRVGLPERRTFGARIKARF
jgi:iron complex outermembrane receptor protein